MNVSNQVESIWMGSTFPIVNNLMQSISLVSTVDYVSIFGVIATGMGLIGVKSIELWKQYRTVKKETENSDSKWLNCTQQLVIQKDNYEEKLSNKDILIFELKTVIEQQKKLIDKSSGS